ncbi:MAG TPA: hypothetical protein VMP67_05940 [Candidatus Limnocylindria bacterium]|nr:hypothetical protein [Candidatus Limnocylindria bacterium]
MSEPERYVGAAVDVGSNSIHLLVAEIRAGALSHLHEQSVLLGLGDVVDQTGELPEASRRQVLEALLVLTRIAHEKGAQAVTLLGTEPLRRATNASELSADVERAFHQPLHILDVEAEAWLTYVGVSGGREPEIPTLIVDIGGGSTEIIMAQPGLPPVLHSLPTGSARLGLGIVLNDPPTPSEFDRLRAGARPLVGALPARLVERAIFVGGTATNLVKLVPLSRAGLEEAHGLLLRLSHEELVERYGINARRARQLPAGAALVEALLGHFRLEAAGVSQASLRDGAILAAAVLGKDWPARLDELQRPA